MVLFTLSSQFGDKPYVFTLIGAVCQNTNGYGARRQESLDMFASFP